MDGRPSGTALESPGRSSNGGEPKKTARAQRLEWLALQYPSPKRRPNIDDFSPDVYDRLARAFGARGIMETPARSSENGFMSSARSRVSSFARPFLFLYAFFFDSGMSPARAVATFLGCIAIGTAAVYIADRGWPLNIDPVLVLETTTVNSLVVPSKESAHAFIPGLLIGATTTAAVDELPADMKSSRFSMPLKLSSRRWRSAKRDGARSPPAQEACFGGLAWRSTPSWDGSSLR